MSISSTFTRLNTAGLIFVATESPEMQSHMFLYTVGFFV